MTNSELTGTVSISQEGTAPEHITNVQVSNGNAILPASVVTASSFTGSLTIQGNGQVSDSAVGGLTINGMGDVQGVASNGSISISSGQVLGSSAKGSINVGAGGTVSNCELSTGGINAGSGSTITHNNVENASVNGISSSGNSTVTFNRVVGAAQGIVASAGMVENNLVANTTGDGLRPGTASVRNNTFTGIEGNAVYLDNVPAAFEFNNFEFNVGSFDVYVAVPYSVITDLQAQNNWWGTTDTDLIEERTFDYFDEYNLAKLLTAPVLEQPSQTAPGYVRSVTLDPESPVGIETVKFSVEYSKPMNVSSTPQITIFDAYSDSWTTKSDMLTARANFGLALAVNGKIYAIGGHNVYYGHLSIVEEYDPSTDVWTTKTPMPITVYCPGIAAANNGKIYIVGGSILEEYDPLFDTWVTKSTIPTNRSCPGVAAASNGKIYVIGGDDSNSIVEEYDPLTDKWTTKTPMPTARLMPGVAAANNGKIYVVGGSPNGTIVEEYDPLTDTWSTKTPMPTARGGGYRFGLTASSNGKLYAIGGFSAQLQSPIAVVEEYDPSTDSWSTMDPMLTARVDLGAIHANDGKIYAIGGFDSLGYYYSNNEKYVPKYLGLVNIITDPTWIDEIHFQASFDFSAINPRGDYCVFVENAIDNDNMIIPPDKRIKFSLDYAGEISDTTPPPTPTVWAWGNGGLSQLSASALADDPDSLIVGYRYAIGSTSGGTEVVNWTNISQNQVTHTGLSLLPDQAYYVSFQARNEGGLWSPIGVSNPVVNGAELKSIYLPLTLR